MVRKIKKYCITLFSVFALSAALCGSVQAATHSVYDGGNLSSTYTTYFRDILSGTSILDNYIAFRSGQYEYTMIVGNLEVQDGIVTLSESGKEYVFYTETSGYNSQYRYNVNEITDFSLEIGDYIIYSDIGDYPELIERGAKFEILACITLCVLMLCIVISRIFYYRKR